MPVLKILLGDHHPILRGKTRKVPRVTREVLKLLKDMQMTVKDAKGAGLAAPQVNSDLRICLTLVNGKMIPMINPEITWKSDETDVAEEGCLSLPGQWLMIPRAKEIAVRWMDESGAEQERRLKDFDARVVQHEVDHLEGILIVDYGMIRSPTAPAAA